MATTRSKTNPAEGTHPRRGEIYLTALDPTVGREIKKTRPALIIQNDTSNRLSETTIVAPITSTVRFPLNPVHAILAPNATTGLSMPSVALLNQIRTVDRRRLIKRLGSADSATIKLVNRALEISVGLVEL